MMLTVVIVVVLAFAFLVYRKMGATSDRVSLAKSTSYSHPNKHIVLFAALTYIHVPSAVQARMQPTQCGMYIILYPTLLYLLVLPDSLATALLPPDLTIAIPWWNISIHSLHVRGAGNLLRASAVCTTRASFKRALAISMGVVRSRLSNPLSLPKTNPPGDLAFAGPMIPKWVSKGTGPEQNPMLSPTLLIHFSEIFPDM